MWIQKKISLTPRSRGFHIITDIILESIPELKDFKAGILQLFIKHTSASLTINENADPTVRIDFESHFNILAPENKNYYKHTCEGPDDMPAHLKSLITQSNLTISIKNKEMLLGTWQGIFLLEHRYHPKSRELFFHILGE